MNSIYGINRCRQQCDIDLPGIFIAIQIPTSYAGCVLPIHSFEFVCNILAVETNNHSNSVPFHLCSNHATQEEPGTRSETPDWPYRYQSAHRYRRCAERWQVDLLQRVDQECSTSGKLPFLHDRPQREQVRLSIDLANYAPTTHHRT